MQPASVFLTFEVALLPLVTTKGLF